MDWVHEWGGRMEIEERVTNRMIYSHHKSFGGRRTIAMSGGKQYKHAISQHVSLTWNKNKEENET